MGVTWGEIESPTRGFSIRQILQSVSPKSCPQPFGLELFDGHARLPSPKSWTLSPNMPPNLSPVGDRIRLLTREMCTGERRAEIRLINSTLPPNQGLPVGVLTTGRNSGLRRGPSCNTHAVGRAYPASVTYAIKIMRSFVMNMPAEYREQVAAELKRFAADIQPN